MSASKSYDLIVFGATSFVGKLLTAYLLQQIGAHEQIKWAIAGRSQEKLQQLRHSLGANAVELPLVIADAHSKEAIAAMCQQTRAVVSTVGPYALHGTTLLATCAELGTDYCDLTGEIPWIVRMLRQYESVAKQTGARIINCCGFDSIPFDLGVFYLQQAAKQRFGQACTVVKTRVKRIKGGFSGGTIASMLNIIRQAGEDKDLRRQVANPYVLCPEDQLNQSHQTKIQRVQFDNDLNAWMTPFIMAPINESVIHRTNVLSGYQYGKAFTYNEALLTGAGIKGRGLAHSIYAALTSFMLAATISPLRWGMQRFFLPHSGEGPSHAAQLAGYYELIILGKTSVGDQIVVQVTGDQDPGYGSTAKILGQAAIALTNDVSQQDKKGGMWTPATFFDTGLITRLQDSAGLKFNVLSEQKTNI